MFLLLSASLLPLLAEIRVVKHKCLHKSLEASLRIESKEIPCEVEPGLQAIVRIRVSETAALCPPLMLCLGYALCSLCEGVGVGFVALKLGQHLPDLSIWPDDVTGKFTEF